MCVQNDTTVFYDIDQILSNHLLQKCRVNNTFLFQTRPPLRLLFRCGRKTFKSVFITAIIRIVCFCQGANATKFGAIQQKLAQLISYCGLCYFSLPNRVFTDLDAYNYYIYGSDAFQSKKGYAFVNAYKLDFKLRRKCIGATESW